MSHVGLFLLLGCKIILILTLALVFYASVGLSNKTRIISQIFLVIRKRKNHVERMK